MKLFVTISLLLASSFAVGQTQLTQCQTITLTGSYALANDVTCTVQGFAINADNVSFDLNGHNINFGNPTTIVPAFSLCDTWYFPSGLAHSLWPLTNCGNGHHRNFRITNSQPNGGNVLQTPGSQPFTNSFHVGQGNGITPGSVTHVNATVQERGSGNWHCEYCVSGWEIAYNTFTDNATNIQHDGQTPLGARSAFQGSNVSFSGTVNATGVGDNVHDNWIIGAPQTAIYSTNQNSIYADNIIIMSSWYSNDYGIEVIADHVQVLRNSITGRGRGIDMEASFALIDRNYVEVYAEANNSEYGGCELGGSDALRLKTFPYQSAMVGFQITNNIFIVDPGPCVANALRMTAISYPANGTFSNNTFQSPQYALSLMGDNNPSINFTLNHFYGTSVQIDWDGANLTVGPTNDWNLTGTTVVDGDGPSQLIPFRPILLNLQGYTGPASVTCMVKSSGLITLGTFTKQCP